MNEYSEAFLGKLNDKTRGQFLMASQVSREVLPSASLEYNWATGGGFPRNGITTLYGNFSSTKTALVLQSIGGLQKQGLVCAFVAVEGYDPEWAAKLGVDNDSLILITKKSFGAITDRLQPLIRAGIDFIGWDSISQTLPEQFVEDGEAKAFENQKQIGAASRSAGVAINALQYDNERTAIVLISQTRTDMNSGLHAMQKPTNGKIIEFSSSVMVRMAASGGEKQQIKGNIFIGDRIHELPIGREVKIEITKNKMGPPNRVASYKFYYSGDEIGIDNVDELITLGKRYGVVRASGAWVYYGDQQWNGQAKFVTALKEDPDLFASVEADINMMTTGEVQDELGRVQEQAEESGQ